MPPMTFPLPLFLLFLALIGILATTAAIFLIIKLSRRATPLPKIFHSRLFLTKGEAAFYRVLLQAVQNQYTIMAKVRLADIVTARSPSNSIRTSHLNRISSKHVDFLLLNPADLTIALVIELDDKSHHLPHRQSRDAFVDQCLAQAAIPILHIPAAATYNPQLLRTQITHSAPGQ